MRTKILQIIPTPPNSSDGIGNYVLLLVTQVLNDAQSSTHFLVFRTDSYNLRCVFLKKIRGFIKHTGIFLKEITVF